MKAERNRIFKHSLESLVKTASGSAEEIYSLVDPFID